MSLIFERIQTDGIAELSYLVGDDSEGVAAVFDPRPDVDCYLQLACEKQVSITHIFETHIHVEKEIEKKGKIMNSRANTHPLGGLILKCAYFLIGSLALLLIFAAADAGASVDARDYPGPAWSPYLVGAAIGVLSWLTFYFSDEPIGASSFYAHLAGFLGKVVTPRHTKSRAYFKDNPPRVGWGFVFVVAVIIGGAIASLTGGEFANEWLSPMWVARFGDSIALRAMIAFGGGMPMAFGARLAGGCTSGHGISGTLQLNLASWISLICFFIGGVAVAIPLFKW